jgi:hypothetical protein
MPTEENVVSGDSTLAALMRQGVTLAHILMLLQEAYPKHWQQHVRNRLGATQPADLTLAQLSEFTDHVFWMVKQTGMKDPAAMLVFRAQLDAKEAAAKLGPSVVVADITAQRKSAERERVTLENNSSMTYDASSSRKATVASGTTEAEVLSRAKAAVEAGESPRDTAERLASAQEVFHTSQREMGRAIGRSASWVNRLLKWRRSGFKQSSAFGPTTRAGRVSHREDKDPDGRQGCEQLGNEDVSLVVHCSPPLQSLSRPATTNQRFPARATQAKPPTSTEAVRKKTTASGTETNPADGPGCERAPSISRQPEVQKPSADSAKAGRKRSPERMRLVVDALTEFPILDSAAAKARIHTKALAYWLKSSEAGHCGYDVEWRGETWRFHEHCKSAIDEAHDKLHSRLWQMAMGIKFKIDPALVKLGYSGVDAYATDENGYLIEEGIREPNPKMMLLYLQWMRPERWAKPRKRDPFRTGGVFVSGQRTKQRENSSSASAKARRWKAVARKV